MRSTHNIHVLYSAGPSVYYSGDEERTMADYDDIELDEETLRKIEEEALREAEAEMAQDHALMEEIEAEALAEVGVEDIELDDDFLEELKLELANLSEEDLDLDDMELEDFEFDLSELDVSDIQAEAPLAGSDTGMVKKAQVQARQKVRKRMVEQAAEQIHQHQKLPPKPISIEMMEADIKNKSGTLKIALILVTILVLIGVAGATAMIIIRGNDNSEPLEPVRIIKDSSGNTLTPQELEAQKKKKEAMKLFQVVLNAGKRGHQSIDDLKAALANIETLRKDFPEFAKEHEAKLAEREKKITSDLAFYEGNVQQPSPGK